jgi:hypothetical protein
LLLEGNVMLAQFALDRITSVDPSPAEHARISHLSQMLSVSAAKPTPAKTAAMVAAE